MVAMSLYQSDQHFVGAYLRTDSHISLETLPSDNRKQLTDRKEQHVDSVSLAEGSYVALCCAATRRISSVEDVCRFRLARHPKLEREAQ